MSSSHESLKLLLDCDGRPREECGVFGIIGAKNPGVLTALGLHALQHRGQDACGIAMFEGKSASENAEIRSGSGLVSKVFADPTKLRKMNGRVAIGHVRYATRGKKNDPNAIQPFAAITNAGSFALAHNGQFTNSHEVRTESLKSNYSFRSNSDSEAVVGAIATCPSRDIIERIKTGVSQMRGAFGLVIATHDRLIGIRDPNGIRPLVLGKLRDDGGYVLASESCALDIVDAELIRDIVPGEMIIIDAQGYISDFSRGSDAKPCTCVFEYVYFSRPDSILDGKSIYEVRYNLGLQMAKQEREKYGDDPLADVVISVPDSGNPAAMGFAKGLGLDFQMGIIRNHYVGRSFIEPTQSKREERVRMKHNPNKSVLKDKRIYIVDDSLVRGNTSRNIVDLVRRAGARDIHFRISCPQVQHSCIYGIDIPNDDELISRHHTGCISSIARQIGMDSIDFLELSYLYKALGIHEPRNPEKPQLTDHYFTGLYPVPQEEGKKSENSQNAQLSLPLRVAK